jgi:heme exporter protein C
MNDMTTPSDAPSPDPHHAGGAFGGRAPAPGGWFLVLAAAALLLLGALNWMIVKVAPLSAKQIGASYLIQFYHVPSAILMTLAYVMVAVAGVFVLVTRSPDWDRRARAAASVGVLANAVVLLTGAVWGKAAWNVWWRFDDPKLTSAAGTFLVYVAYVVLARGLEDAGKRMRVCAIYGIVGALSLVFIYYAPRLFGTGSHPPSVDQKDPAISGTLSAAMVAFLVFYVLLYQWRYDLEALRDRADAAFGRLRRLEEARS